MTYDSWKARSPDDGLGDPSMYEKPDPARERADWEDAKLEIESDASNKCSYCGGAGRFMVRDEQSWPDDGREWLQPKEPFPMECRVCGGKGYLAKQWVNCPHCDLWRPPDEEISRCACGYICVDVSDSSGDRK